MKKLKKTPIPRSVNLSKKTFGPEPLEAAGHKIHA